MRLAVHGHEISADGDQLGDVRRFAGRRPLHEPEAQSRAVDRGADELRDRVMVEGERRGRAVAGERHLGQQDHVAAGIGALGQQLEVAGVVDGDLTLGTGYGGQEQAHTRQCRRRSQDVGCDPW